MNEFFFKVLQKTLDKDTLNVSCKDSTAVGAKGLCVGFIFRGKYNDNDEWICVSLEKAVEPPVFVGSATKRMTLCLVLKIAIEGRMYDGQPSIEETLKILEEPQDVKKSGELTVPSINETHDYGPFEMLDLSDD